MEIKSYRITDDLRLAPLDPELAAETSQREDANVWIDLKTSDSSELEEWLDRLEVKGLSRRLCLEARDRPAFYPLKDELLLVIPVLSVGEDSDEVDHVVLLYRKDLLITIHGRPILSLQQTALLQKTDTWLPERSIAGLVSALLIGMSLEYLQRIADVRKSVFALVERMDREPDDVEIEDIMDMRSEIIAIGVVVSDQLPAIKALSTSDTSFSSHDGARNYLNCALVNMQAVEGSMEWLDQRISNLLVGYNMYSQEKTNRRLGLLTILSAIFMPITLLAGIWGMNFRNMPELEFKIGYPAALCFMAFIGIGMFLFFRRKGWFD